MYKLKWARQAKKDYEIAVKNGYAGSAAEMLSVIKRDPYEDTPGHHYEELRDNLKGIHSRRFNRANRLTYKILPNDENLLDENGKPYEGIVRILTMWGHPY